MKKVIALFATLAISAVAHANCYGSGSYYTCNDASGNTYNVQRYGNTTNVQGSNPYTGSNWNQSSTTMGNTTFHNGNAANGQSWSGTSQHIGGTTFHNGMDSRGQPYSKTCNRFGCH